VHVNLLASRLQEADIVDKVAEALAASRLEPAAWHWKSASAVLPNLAVARERLAALRRAASGARRLPSVTRSSICAKPIDTVKIDRVRRGRRRRGQRIAGSACGGAWG
jgi:hypothetical protein